MRVNFKLIIVFIVTMIVAMSVAIKIGQGDFKSAYTSTVLIFIVPLLLFLGVKLWYFLPFAMMALLPALPFIGGRSIVLSEISILAFVAIYTLTLSMGRVKLRLPLKDFWPMILFTAWIMLIAVIDGGGLAVFGASSFGGRRYLTVILAFIGMVGLAQFAIEEKQAKRFALSITGALVISGIYVAFTTYMGRSGMSSYEFYSWQQGLSLVSLGGTMLMFAHYKPFDIIFRPSRLILYLVLLVLVAYSGKRMLFGVCCLIPVFAGFWHSQKTVSVLAGAIGVLSIFGICVAQNSGASVPQSLQRVLSFMPANWDDQVEMSSNNIFRETLNRWAWMNVDENPIIGKGISLTLEDYMLMENKAYVSQIRGVDDDVQAFPHIAGKNWHSTWLGLAASFGYPAAIFWMIVQWMVLKRTWQYARHYPQGSWIRTLLGILFFYMIFGVMRSLTTGDVALLAMDGALIFGILSAIRYGEMNLPEGQKQVL